MTSQDQITPVAMKVRDAAARYGISRTKLYRLIGEGKIPAKADGGNTLVLRKDMEAYLDTLPARVV